MITTILFDLDGTLLPMDQEVFIGAYMKGLCKKAMPFGYESQKLIKSIWAGTEAMIKNTGEKTNEDVFWDVFTSIFGKKAREDEKIFDDFYKNEFQEVKNACGFQPMAKELIETIKGKNKRLVLATNPIFPRIATESRISWAGLDKGDFEYITTYENSHFCKPNPDYYKEILENIGVKAEDCLMVGNDVNEDMISETLGMKAFLLTDCIINKNDKDISVYKHGSFADLIEFIRALD